MSLNKYIRSSLKKVEQRNQSAADKHKKRLLKQIQTNLMEKGESVQDNQGLISRYHGAKPKGFNAMQQAFAEAV